MDQRRAFIEDYLRRDVPFAALCHAYGISRQCGYETVDRFKKAGWPGLLPQSRAPRHHPNAVPAPLEARLLELRAEHPFWGPRKLLDYLTRREPHVAWPVASTVGEILRRRGLTSPRRRARRTPPFSQPLGHAGAPNDVWCTDFKGWFRTADGARFDPFTLTDAASRMLLRCQGVERTGAAHVQPLLVAAFREFGLPWAIRSDNGAPFASTGLAGLSRLSVWWIRLGIWPERIEPGCPEQNGRHERMHGTLAREAADPPAANRRAQQRRLDAFRREYNEQRPHQALGGSTPSERYAPSPRRYPARLPAPEYPEGSEVRRVRQSGEVKWQGRVLFLSEVLVGEQVAFYPLDEGRWGLYFGPLRLGMWDEPLERLIREVTAPARTKHRPH